MESKPTENQEQPKGTPLVPDQVSEWGDVMRMQEPGLFAEHGEEVRKAPEDEEDKETQEEVEPQEEYTDPEPVVTVEDPGDYTPKDYSFEVTIYDEEGKNGKPVKVTTLEQFEELLEKDSNFGSPSALLKAQRLVTKMESNLDRDRATWQEKKDAFEAQSQSREAQINEIRTVEAEIQYLVSSGKLPDIADVAAKTRWQTDSSAWKDAEFIKTPGVKEQVELLSYMRKESDKRVKAGLPRITSALDAYNAMQLDQRHQQDKEKAKKSAEARKTAGARVAGSSPAPVSNVPKGIMVGRGGNLRDLDAGWSI